MRKPRRIVVNARYHVIARANRNEYILATDRTKRLLLRVVSQAADRFRFTLDTLCVMDNHIHLLIWPQSGESLSRIMQWILATFALRFNRMHGLRGHVWYDRFKSVVIRTLAQFARVYRYITENPVRARMVKTARDYPYGTIGVRQLGLPGVLDPPSYLARMLFPMDWLPP